MKVKAVVCDLCHHQPPSVYCSSDSAFLCSGCDSQVHTANFLVARHIRVSICSNHSDCDDVDDASSSSSSSSTICNSSIDHKTTSTTSNSDRKTSGVLVSWWSRLGGSMDVIEVARHAFQVWLINRSEWAYHYRVGLAASLWLGFTKHSDKNNRIKMRTILKRLEEVSGVPAKSIVVEQLKLASKFKIMKRAHHQEEGWAESKE